MCNEGAWQCYSSLRCFNGASGEEIFQIEPAAFYGAQERMKMVYTALTSPLSCIMMFSDPMIMVRWHKATAV